MSSTFWKPAPPTKLTLAGGDNDDEQPRNQQDVAAAPLLLYPKSRAPLMHQRMLLPIYKHKRQILYAVENYGVVVIVGETGSGKSTQIPQFLVEGGWTANDFAIVCTQPRRIAATTLATRVAQEAGCQLGDRVGYTVRFDDQSSPQTQVKVRNHRVIVEFSPLYFSFLRLQSHLVRDGRDFIERSNIARSITIQVLCHYIR